MSIDEFSLLAELTGDLASHAEGLLCGVGDDAAVLTGNVARDWVVSVDSYSEGIHFRRQWCDFARLGGKAARAALSDISAMGGKPRFMLVALCVPDGVSVTDIHELNRGVREVCDAAGALIIGGDTTRATLGVQIHLTVIGEVPHGRAIYRRGARAGDAIYCTGLLGGSRAGLALLEHQIDVATLDPSDISDDQRAALITRHLAPALRVATAQWLSSTSCVTAMIDCSDGLLGDLAHIARMSNVRCAVEAVRVPIFPGASAVANALQEDPLRLAVASGEEYELIFTVERARAAAFRGFIAAAERMLQHPITQIGEVTDGTGVDLLDHAGNIIEVASRGFMHEFGR